VSTTADTPEFDAPATTICTASGEVSTWNDPVAGSMPSSGTASG
jgi:hypothetical protein